MWNQVLLVYLDPSCLCGTKQVFQCYLTAGHAVELPYVFHTATLGGFHYTPDELVLSDTLINYWTNFARYGNPNGKGEHPVRGIGKFNPQVGGGLQCM